MEHLPRGVPARESLQDLHRRLYALLEKNSVRPQQLYRYLQCSFESPARFIVEIGLFPLHRIMLRRRARDDAGDVRAGMPCSENSVSTMSIAVFPDAAIGAARQKPHLRPQHQRIGAKPAADGRALVEFGDEPVERTAPAVFSVETQKGCGRIIWNR